MRRLLLPLLMALVGLALGTGIAVAMKWAGDRAAPECPAAAPDEPEQRVLLQAEPRLDYAYVRLNNQFVVPVTQEGRIKALVVLSISLEITPDASETVYAREPRLRDAFLRVLFDHANSGGFDGEFTSNGAMVPLREALRDAARQIMGAAVNEVLITEIARQDS